ncbi:MAG: hypothetical protein AB1391_00350 [Candidatus Micrarchaeota archaeon]
MAELISGWQGIAGTAIVISIIISSIALGLGKAFSIKRLERFGIEEIIQSIINAAILGFAIGLCALVIQIGAEFTTSQMKNITCLAIADNDTNITVVLNTSEFTPPDYILCGINATINSSHALAQNLIQIENTLGYYQTLVLHFGNFSIQPLVNLDNISKQLANSMYVIQLSMFASTLNAQFLTFISSNWFATIFATGLVLRSFFISRKFGAFLIGVSIAFIIFYPLMLMMFQLPIEQLNTNQNLTSTFLNNSVYQTVPIVDLNNNNEIANKLYDLGFSDNNDFTGDLIVITQRTTDTAANLFFYSVIIPFFALIVVGVLIKEFSNSFAGEIAIEVSKI